MRADSDERPEGFDALAAAYVERLRQGDAVDPEQYAAAHPDHADEIRRLFPVLSLMEGMKGTAAEEPDAVLQPAPMAGVPTRVGPYTLKQEIGRGGMGRVFEATAADGARVAIKLIHPHLVGRSTYLDRFLREAEAGKRIDHEGVVKTLDAAHETTDSGAVPYLVLEFVEGQSLRQLIDEVGDVPERLARVIGARVADALAAVHDAGVVHRDVKPANVVITDDETVKLMDLGVALLQEEANRLSQTGEFVGSLLYAAPEQLKGDTPSPATDLFALGILLHELLTGQHPSKQTGMARPTTLGHEAAAPRALNPDISPFIDHVVRTLLARDPAARFQDASAVADLLRDGEASDWWKEEGRDDDAPLRRTYDRPVEIQGRDDELRVLDKTMETVLHRKGQAVIVEGEAGIGKTRLVNEWLDQLEAKSDAATVLVAKYAPGESALATPPIANAFLALLGEDDLETRLASVLADARRLAAPLAKHLLGEDQHQVPPAVNPSTVYPMLLGALARERPVVLVLEDLHFGKDTAYELVLAFARALEDARVLILATSRPGAPPAFTEGVHRLENVKTLLLDGLDAKACRQLISEALGERASASRGARQLIQTADGNPFCLLEFAHDLRRRRDEGAPKTTVSMLRDLEIPSSVRHLIDGRLGGISHEERDLLSAAACCGDRFDPVLVIEAMQVPRIHGLKTFLALDRRYGLITPDGDGYRFRHHLVLESLYGELPKALKAAYHQALGHALERNAAGDVDKATAFALSRHLLLGDDVRSAVPYLEAGLDHLSRAGEMARAQAMADFVVELGGEVPNGVRVRALRGVGEAELARGSTGAALKALEEAWRLAQDGDVAERARVAGVLGNALRHNGRMDDAIGMFRQGVELAIESGDHETLAGTYGRFSMTLQIAGRIRQAKEAAVQGLAHAAALDHPSLEATAIRQLALIESNLGNVDRARKHAQEAVRLAREIGDVLAEVDVTSIALKIERGAGMLDTVATLTERMVDAARVMGHTRMEIVSLTNLGHVYVDLGRFADGVERIELSLEIGKDLEYPDHEVYANSALGSGLMRLGRFAEGEAAFQKGVAASVILQSPEATASVRGPYAGLLAQAGRFDEAQDHILEATTLLTSVAANVETGGLLRAQGLVHELNGRFDEARAAFARGLEVEAGSPFFEARFRVPLARIEIARGNPEGAHAHLDEVLALAAETTIGGLEPQARLLRGALDDTEVLNLRVLLEEAGDTIPVPDRMITAALVGAIRGDEGLLRMAREDFRHIDAHTAETHRPALRSTPAYRDLT